LVVAFRHRAHQINISFISLTLCWAPANFDAPTLAFGAVGNRVTDVSIGHQVLLLFLFAIPVACVSWTVTHEDILRELREWLTARSNASRNILSRKFFYLFTCEYCFSHYVTAFFLLLTRYTLLFDDWRGYLVAGFSLVWLANVYMSFFGRLRLEIRGDRMEIAATESREGVEARNAHERPPKNPSTPE